MSRPLVSVICLCYNHYRFLREAVESVLHQSYSPLQIIIVDDASTDGSQLQIAELGKQYSQLEILLLPQNQGNCKAFNQGWRLAKGQYLIDFATDDVMHPERISKQIQFFSQLDSSYGVVFTDSIYIDEDGKQLRNHFEYLTRKNIIKSIPQGDVFRDVLTRYFISGPSMMVRSEVMQVLGGYDETLAYEDFDFWVRSSRIYKYALLNERLTFVRKSSRSMSTGWYQHGDRQVHSTFLICQKAIPLCRTNEDRDSLTQRVSYEFRQALFSGNREEAMLFKSLLHKLRGWNWRHSILQMMASMPLPWPKIRSAYHSLFYS